MTYDSRQGNFLRVSVLPSVHPSVCPSVFQRPQRPELGQGRPKPGPERLELRGPKGGTNGRMDRRTETRRKLPCVESLVIDPFGAAAPSTTTLNQSADGGTGTADQVSLMRLLEPSSVKTCSIDLKFSMYMKGLWVLGVTFSLLLPYSYKAKHLLQEATWITLKSRPRCFASSLWR